MNWSQPMLQEEWKCARDVADKLGMKFSMVHVDSAHIWDTVDMKRMIMFLCEILYLLQML